MVYGATNKYDKKGIKVMRGSQLRCDAKDGPMTVPYPTPRGACYCNVHSSVCARVYVYACIH